MAQRKFEVEFAVSIVCCGMFFGRQREYEKVPSSIAEDCHIYVISRQPKLSIDPASVTISKARFKADILVQRGGTFERHPVVVAHRSTEYPGPLEWRSEWPHDTFEMVEVETGEVFMHGPTALLIKTFAKYLPKEIFNQEVLYIGQAYGKEGERTAYDRLRKHETLQRVYAENRPDYEIWLTLCSITDIVMIQQHSPDGHNSVITDDASNKRAIELIKWFHSEGFKKKEAVALAEAGLIRYFQPEYNKKFRGNFPDPQHVNSATCYDLEINDLTIEFHGNGVENPYWSTSAQPSDMHFANYQLYSETDRAWLMDPLLKLEK